MTELSLEALAKRIEAIEQKLVELSLPTKPKDWRTVVGISEDNEFNRLVLAEIEANSEAERRAALEENPE
ncbi:MAG TPA: hypothetical protein VG122_10815 [Gemmata sp.]|jgi:hypothetical protein|nr:hypothetical protein [Gemmata sp.]